MKNIKLVNLTPHAVNFVLDDWNEVVIDPSGIIARLSTKTVTVGSVNGIPVTMTEFGPVENLPDPEEGTIYIASSLVAQAVKGKRNDVLIPNETVRDDAGRIIGCKSLGII